MSDARQHLPDVLTETVSETTCVHCGVRLNVEGLPPFADLTCKDCQTVQKVPAKLGHFLLLDLIGTGGMGGVYFAEDLTLGRRVAIKVMLKSLGDNPEFIDTFKREAQAVAKLNHPSIAQIYSFGMEKDQPYIVMELVSGYRFDKMVESQDQLDQGLIARIGREIAEGLAAASEVGLIHGDIKPENILLDEKLNAKLVDFGLASFKQQATESQVWGTPYYIAPEKIRRKKADERSDIYSLGATLYHALAGKPPFEGETPMAVVMARLKETPVPLSEVRKDINPRLEGVVMRMLEQSPSKRHPTYASLVSDLRAVVKELGADKIDLATISRRTARMRLGKSKTGLITTSLSETSRVLDRTSGMIDTDTTLIRKSSNLSDSSTEILSQYRKQSLEDSTPSEPTNKLAIVLTVVGILLVAGIAGGTGLVMHKLSEQKAAEQRAHELADTKQLVTAGLKELWDGLTKIQVAFETTSALADKATDLETRLQVMLDAMGSTGEFDVHSPAQSIRDASVKMDERWATAKTISESADKVEIDSRDATTLDVVNDAKTRLGTLKYQLRVMMDEDEKNGVTDPAADFAALQALEPAIIERKAKFDADAIGRKKREEIEKKQAEERARIEAEVQNVETAVEGVKPMVLQRRYRKALTTLTIMQNKFKGAPPAAAKLQIAIDRLQRMDDLLKFVTDRLHEDGFPSGYLHPKHQSYIDILDADAVGISGRANTHVAWADITDKQMKRFVDHFVMDEGLTLTMRAEQSLNAAIFCDMIGNRVASEQYASRAVSLRASLKLEVDRLIPKAPVVESVPETEPASTNTPPAE